MTRRGHAFPGQDLPDREPQDLEVKPEGSIVHIPHVEPELLLPADGIATVHLRPSRDAGLDLVAAHLLGSVKGQVLGKQGARPNEAHVALDDVPEGGQLVEAGGAEELAKAREADGIGRKRVLAGLGITHRLELVEREGPAVEANAGLAENTDTTAECNLTPWRQIVDGPSVSRWSS